MKVMRTRNPRGEGWTRPQAVKLAGFTLLILTCATLASYGLYKITSNKDTSNEKTKTGFVAHADAQGEQDAVKGCSQAVA